MIASLICAAMIALAIFGGIVLAAIEAAKQFSVPVALIFALLFIGLFGWMMNGLVCTIISSYA